MQAWAWSVRDVAMQPDENRQAMVKGGQECSWPSHHDSTPHTPSRPPAQDGMTALMYAAKHKADGVASQLIAAGADMDAEDKVRHHARMVVARGALSGVCGSRAWEMQAWD